MGELPARTIRDLRKTNDYESLVGTLTRVTSAGKVSVQENEPYFFRLLNVNYSANLCFDQAGKLLRTNPNSHLAHYVLGRVLLNEELFRQAYLIITKGLELSTQGIPEIHSQFHFSLSDLEQRAIRKEPKPNFKEIGFDVEKMNFDFDEVRGFRPRGIDDDFYYFCRGEESIEDVKVKALSSAHLKIGELEMKGKVKSCPFKV